MTDTAAPIHNAKFLRKKPAQAMTLESLQEVRAPKC